MKNVLAIDYSVNGTSFVFNDGEKVECLFFSEFKQDENCENCIKVQKDRTTLEKVDNVIKALEAFIDNTKEDLIVLESPSYSSNNKRDDFRDGYAIIKYICRKHNIKHLLVPPVSLKLYITGNSKAEKEDVRQAIIKEFNIDYKEITNKKWDNICDARSLYELGKDYLKCSKLPDSKNIVDTSDIKYFDTLPLYRQQVIAKLYGREDLYKEIVKQRNKNKTIDKK